MSKVNATVAAALASAVFMTGGQVFAAQCNAKGGFPAFVTEFKKEAAQSGISQRGLAALDGVTLDQQVLAADRKQGVFKQSFEQFSGRMISRDRLSKGGKLMQQYAGQLKHIEQKYGVPGAVVVAIWAWRRTTASTRASSTSFARSRPSPTTAAAATNSRPSSWTRCASSTTAPWPPPT